MMSLINRYILLILLSSLIFSSCTTYKEQYDESVANWNEENLNSNDEIDHIFYFIGDGGKASKEKNKLYFKQFQEDIVSANENTTVLFLGDNIYEKGMPKKNHPDRKAAEEVLDAQIALVDNFKGQPIFIPGNHDYYNNGVKGLKREAKYITNKLNDKNAFLPNNECPLDKIDISDDIVLIIVDTQWYLENWDKQPTINDDCDIKTRAQFFYEFESLIKKNAAKTTLIAMHHPMFSNGSHGGQFSMKQQIYPSNGNFPLPIIGSIVNVVRKTGGVSSQDLQNSLYLSLKKRIVTLSQKSQKVIFVSGHEHSLQYIFKDNKPQIISGSGSKYSAARATNGGEFSYGGIGYAKLIVYKNGSSWVYYYSENNGERRLLFKKQVHGPDKIQEKYDYPLNFPDTISASIYSDELISSGKSSTIWGEHYRKYYATKVAAQTVLLDTFYGGLTPIRKGGGKQSRSLRLVDKDGKEYVMRALLKSATKFLQATAFIDQYIEGQFDDTYTENLIFDFYTSAHPYTPFVIGTIADAVGIYHTNPKLYYIPKQKALKQFNSEFGDELYLFEERAASGHGDLKSFGYSNKLISTYDLLKKIRESDDYYIDENAYIKARLFDMVLGDWDRHYDQWRWAQFKDGKKTMYKPVPRDRDQAFSKFDGFLLELITRYVPEVGMMQVYDHEIRNIKKFNGSPAALDKFLITQATYKDWEKQVLFLQENITDEVLEKAFDLLPVEVQTETIEEIKSKLKSRLKILPEIARTYYNYLSKNVIVKGTDKDNWFEIQRLDNGDTSIKIYNIKNKEKGTKIHDKTYLKDETKEIWVYGFNEEDVFKVTGNSKNTIPLLLIGGQNNDKYIIENGKKVTIYDFKSKKNTFETNKGKIKLNDDYEINSYHYKKHKFRRYLPIPIVGYNPDDGVKLGIKNLFTIYGFDRNPFTQQHALNFSYYFATGGVDLMYSGEYANVFNHWNLFVKTIFTSPNYTINYFGMGNETMNLEDEFGDDYYRVRVSARAIYPSLLWKGRMGAQLNLGGILEGVEIENTVDRFINTVPDLPTGRQYYLGVQASYVYENYDNNAFPTLGMRASLDTGWKTNMDNYDENNAFITPSLSINYKLSSSGRLVLATKLNGNIIIGDNYQFYNAASIGGKNGLRGYRNQRFTGDKSFYQNTDIRYNLRSMKTGLVPIQLGIFGGFDYGRVWLDGEESKDWKTSYGGGLSLVGAQMVNINVSLFHSQEGAYFIVGLGFGF